MPRLDRRHAEAADPVHEGLARVVGIEGPQLWLDRRRILVLLLVPLLSVVVPGHADDRAGVHEPGGHHRGAEDLEAGGDLHDVRGTDLGDLTVTDEHDTVLQRRPRHRVDDVASDGHLGRREGSEEREGAEGEGEESSHQSWSPWLSSPKQQK